MKIKKVINNNAVSTIDSEGIEVVLLGAGIGYKKKENDTVEEKQIEKVFSLKNQRVDKLEKLLNRVDAVYFELAEEIIKKTEETLNKQPNEQLLFTLADHLSFAVKSLKEGIFNPNLMAHEIKLLYPNEYSLGAYGRKIVNEKLGINLPDDEESYIALHIVNSGLSGSIYSVENIVILTYGITEILKSNYGDGVIDAESFEYMRFLTHIKYLARRIATNSPVKSIQMEGFAELLVKKDEKLEETIREITDFIYKEFDYLVKKEDEVYLMLHILRIVK